jgi:hypothetical protein
MSLFFDGVDDTASCDWHAALEQPVDAFTEVIWMKFNSASSTFSAVMWGAGPRFAINQTPVMRIEFATNDGANDTGATVTAEAQGTWVMAVGRWGHPSSPTQVLFRIYTPDGTPIINGSGFRSGTSIDYSSQLPRVFGRRAGAGYFGGRLAHSAIWDRALDDAELVELAQGRNPATIDNGNLVEYWPMLYGGRGTVNRDSDLTLTGATVDDDNPPVDPDGMSFAAKAAELGATVIHAQTVDGSEWTDESGNAHHGNVVGATRHASGGPTPGLPGYWSTDGVDDYIEVLDHPDLRATTHSIVAFIRRDANEQNDFSIAMAANGNDNNGWMWRQEGSTEGQFRLTTGGSHYSSSTNAYPSGEWYCFLFQIEPGVNAEIYRIDPDGTRTRVFNRTSPSTPHVNNGLNISYAARDTGSGYQSFFRGDYAAVAQFHGTYLTTAEFDELWAAAQSSGEEFVTLAGTSTTNSTTTGHLTSIRPITGISTTAATATGSLTTEGRVVLAGASTTTATATGSLARSRLLAGASVTTTVGSGVLTTSAETLLAGTSTTTATATGSLTRAISFTATSTTTATATGSLTVTAPSIVTLAGTSTTTATATGLLAAVRSLTATSTTTATATGLLRTIGTLPLTGASITRATSVGILVVELKHRHDPLPHAPHTHASPHVPHVHAILSTPSHTH